MAQDFMNLKCAHCGEVTSVHISQMFLCAHCGRTEAISSECFFKKVLPKPANEEPVSEGGSKHDQEKPPFELLSSPWVEGVARVLGHGRKKYAAHNWRLGISQGRLLGAALRHVFAYLRGEDLDPESGLSHLLHASCCLMFAFELRDTRPDLDDRYRVGQMDPRQASLGGARYDMEKLRESIVDGAHARVHMELKYGVVPSDAVPRSSEAERPGDGEVAGSTPAGGTDALTCMNCKVGCLGPVSSSGFMYCESCAEPHWKDQTICQQDCPYEAPRKACKRCLV